MNALNRTMCLALLAILVAAAPAPGATGPAAADSLHAGLSELLARYVQGGLVDYDTWHGNATDMAALDRYIEALTSLDPAAWPEASALAYWINLYNAATLQLVLEHYPLDSIKDIGGFMRKSPWNREVVTVGGRRLTLNDIENKIIRPTFGEPRIHFALNCASVGCPPLAGEAYVPDRLDAQLDAACRRALNRDGWVRSEGPKLHLTKIFDWYGEDFGPHQDAVVDFVARYREEPLPDGPLDVEFMAYDWSLNRIR